MITSKEREIDGHTWLVAQFPASESLKILAKLTKLLGPSIAALSGTVEGGKSILDVEVGGEDFARAVSLLVERLDEEDVFNFVKRLLKDTRCDGREVLPEFDILFAGRLTTLIKVLVFVLEVNYEDFFGIVEKVKEVMRAQEQQRMAELKATSGESWAQRPQKMRQRPG